MKWHKTFVKEVFHDVYLLDCNLVWSWQCMFHGVLVAHWHLSIFQHHGTASIDTAVFVPCWFPTEFWSRKSTLWNTPFTVECTLAYFNVDEMTSRECHKSRFHEHLPQKPTYWKHVSVTYVTNLCSMYTYREYLLCSAMLGLCVFFQDFFLRYKVYNVVT